MTAICRNVQAQLSPYLDGELAEARDREIAEHVARCIECRDELDAFEAARLSLTNLDSPPAAPDQWIQIRSRLEGRGISRLPFVPWRWATVAASVLLAIILTVFWPFSADRDTDIEPYLGLYVLAANASDVLTSPVQPEDLRSLGFAASAPPRVGLWALKGVYIHKLHGEPVVQAFYVDGNGTHYCIFQQAAEHPLDFGARSTQQEFVRNQICTKFADQNFHLISWTAKATRFTVISTAPGIRLDSIAADWIRTTEEKELRRE